jgi:AAA family ATP:ADP antiporter
VRQEHSRWRLTSCANRDSDSQQLTRRRIAGIIVCGATSPTPFPSPGRDDDFTNRPSVLESVPGHKFSNIVSTVSSAVSKQLAKLDGLWGRFLPMAALFFLMAFVNTIIDSLKDSLVITAVGGGTEVLPYLSVYGVLPFSVVFLLAYSWGTQRFSRERLFNVIICTFLAFYVAFAFAYPRHEVLHFSGWADSFAAVLPAGLSGLVGMVRNWMFTLFYCFSELWGDIVLSLLFWGLANETTSIEDAPLLYPLFGVGANIAQTVAGRSLRVFSDVSVVTMSYTTQLQTTIGFCVFIGFIIIALHAYISKTFPRNPKGSTAARMALERAKSTSSLSSNGTGTTHNGKHHVDVEATVHGMNYCDIREHQNKEEKNGTEKAGSSGQRSQSLADAWVFLRQSPQIRCLAVMAVAQGITTRLLEVSWKHYLHKLHSTPAAYAAFLGDTAMWTGIITGALMFVSPLLFDRIGWRGVASATPNFMLWGGTFFFIGCILYNIMVLTSAAALSTGTVTLQVLVITGAIMQVFSRGAKFSLFKPAEEMVYIGLDDESRSKGKAAIDVVGAQSGKSVGSILQQALLIITGGSLGGILPVLAVFYVIMLHQWNGAVMDLADHYDPGHAHRLSVMGSLDNEDMQEETISFTSDNGSHEKENVPTYQ